jgi:hypothetical protein
MPRFMESMDGPDFEIYGNLSPELAETMETFKPKVSKTLAGFYR